MSRAEEERERSLTQPITFNKFEGMKNTVSRTRLTPTELERGLNIDIDDRNQIFRRRGFEQKVAGNFHSLWTGERFVLGVKDGSLGVINPDYSFETLLDDAGDARISYDEIADTVYFSSLDVSGKILADKSVVAWGAVASDNTWLSPVVNPTSTLQPQNGQLLGKPPMATSIASLNGRMYLANGSLLWATELYLYDYVDKTRNFIQFEAPITVLGAVTDGLYVGTEEAVWYLDGPLGQMRRRQISEAGAIPGSLVPVTAELVRPERNQSRRAVCFMTHDGLYAGLDSGTCYNMTETSFLFPAASSAAAMFRKQDGVNQYVGVLDSAGTPSSAARIGDYVDAEIVRHS